MGAWARCQAPAAGLAAPDCPPRSSSPPAAILAETRAKQQRAKERVEQGLPAEDPEEEAQAKAAKRAKVGGPLLLEGPGAHLMVATNDAPIPKEVDSEDSDSEEEPEAPPGPPDAAHCKAQGPGFSGAAAGQPVKLTIMARDAAGKRVREGGAHILVMVEPVGAAPAADGGEAEAIEAEVEDHSNGTYTAIYSVPSKGNYQVRGGAAAGQDCRRWGVERGMLGCIEGSKRVHKSQLPAACLPVP